MPQKYWKYKNEIVFYTQLLLLIGLLIILNLAMVGWDINQVRWQIYGASTAFSLYAKIIATNYSSNRALLSNQVENIEKNNVVLLETEIKNIHFKLLEANRTGAFKRALMYRNFKYRLQNERTIIDIKGERSFNYRIKKSEKRKMIQQLLELLDNHKYDEFDELVKDEEFVEKLNIRKLSFKAMIRSNVKMSTLFSTKTTSIDDDLDGGESRLSFNKWSYSFKTQFIFLIGMPILSLLWSGFYYDELVTNKYVWLDVAGYLLTIALGLFSGLSIGTESITKGYYSRLQSRMEVIQEVLNIEKMFIKRD